jgi:uroporphyrinogen III methyltransferase/synthase
MKGIVFLIGTGPGDPGLLTVRGQQCLAAADVVVHDHQVHPRVLGQAPRLAELIDVGSGAGPLLEQDAVGYLLAEKAREGRVVARLKVGDGFTVGPGAGEALFLHEQGVRFEVVPGLSGVIAGPVYAGIPLTYRGAGSTLTVVRQPDAGVQVDWSRVARLDGTVVCEADADHLPGVIRELVSHGRAADEPAAIVYDGTLLSQRAVTGTLSELAQVEPPSSYQTAVLVAGRVTALREHLRWFDTRPLFGRRILVTRPREQAAELSERLEALGAEAIEAPLIRIAPPDDYEPMDRACASLDRFDWIVFTSANAVDSFMGRLLASALDVRALGRVRLCAVGPATSDRLRRYGLKVDAVPAEYRAEALAQVLAATGDVRGLRVFLPRADIGREVVATELRRHGAEVTEATAYRTVLIDPEREGGPDVYRMLLERRLDVVTFTSASAVRSFVTILGEEPAADLLSTTIVASIGPVTAEAAAQHHILTTIMPAAYTIPALVQAIVDHFRAHPGGVS